MEIEASTEAICPLCEQDLSPEHRADLLQRLADQGKEKGDLYRTNLDEIHQREAAIDELSSRIADANIALRSLRALQDHVAQLEERLKQAIEQQQELSDIEHRVADIGEQLAVDAYAEEAQAAQAELYAQLAEVGYDDQAHHAAQEAIQTYEAFESLKSSPAVPSQLHSSMRHSADRLTV